MAKKALNFIEQVFFPSIFLQIMSPASLHQEVKFSARWIKRRPQFNYRKQSKHQKRNNGQIMSIYHTMTMSKALNAAYYVGRIRSNLRQF